MKLRAVSNRQVLDVTCEHSDQYYRELRTLIGYNHHTTGGRDYPTTGFYNIDL